MNLGTLRNLWILCALRSWREFASFLSLCLGVSVVQKGKVAALDGASGIWKLESGIQPSPENAQHRAEGVAAPVWTIARALLFITLFAVPLAFGAVPVWSWASLNLLAVLLVLLWGIGCARQGWVKIEWNPLYAPAALFLLLGLVQHFGQLTLDRFGTREALLKLITDLIFFFLAGQLMASAGAKAWNRLGLGVAVFTFALSLFAILQFFSSPGLIYWSVQPRWGGWVFGPYVNHNHYAGLMEMLIPLAIGYSLSVGGRPLTPPWAHRSPERASGWRIRDRAEAEHPPFRALLAFAVLIPVASVLLSGSRGGFVALVVEGLIWMAVLFAAVHARHLRRLVLKLSLGIVVVTAAFFWMDTGDIASRLATLFQPTHSPEASFGQRGRVTLDSLRLLRDHLWLGTGLGSFETAFPPYQSLPSNEVWDHAHDDYAEALAETGLAGGILILGAMALFFLLAFTNVRKRLRFAPPVAVYPRGRFTQPAGRGWEQSWIQLGAAIGCCGLLVHSLFDFNLHIPSNAAWFAACAALATQPMSTTEKGGTHWLRTPPAEQRSHAPPSSRTESSAWLCKNMSVLCVWVSLWLTKA